MPLPLKSKSQFVDQAKIFVQAGNGGDGIVGFHRAKFVPKGGPDGGDGGRGGDIVIVGSMHFSTLQTYLHRRHFRAKSGERGGDNRKTGEGGESVELKVPLGTVVIDAESDSMIGEVLNDGERLVVQEGGRGGLGNFHFKSSTHQAPRETTPGETREGKWIRLELRLLADIGIVGPPDAGKSTLLGAITAAKPKVAAYPFTTLSPHLGVLSFGERTLTLADLPGLIEGAHEGHGLGIQFLKHVSRTRGLLYMIPLDIGDPEKALENYQMIRNEIGHFNSEILDRPTLVVLNKVDLKSDLEVKTYIDRFAREKLNVRPVSAREKLGLQELTRDLFQLV